MFIVISPTGRARFIYSDEVALALAGSGEARTVRASHVEPAGSQWTADMSPVGGPVLGPFVTRQEALEEEVKWLEEKSLPTRR